MTLTPNTARHLTAGPLHVGHASGWVGPRAGFAATHGADDHPVSLARRQAADDVLRAVEVAEPTSCVFAALENHLIS